jgi:uncharacterized cupredoxin-like copper-binding protein
MPPNNAHIRHLARLTGLIALALWATGCSTLITEPSPHVLNIVLDDGSISPDKRLVASGNVLFRAINTGSEVHELVIIKTDLPADSLPMQDSIVDEGRAGRVIGEIEEFPPGRTKEQVFELAPGRYVLFCNIIEEEDEGELESHYRSGMHAVLTAR